MRQRFLRHGRQRVTVEREQRHGRIAPERRLRQGGKQIETDVQHAQLAQRMDRPDRELRQQVVQQAERAERLPDAREGGLAQALDEIALQIEGGQGVQPVERLHVRPARQLPDAVLRKIQEGERAQTAHRLRYALLLRTLQVEVLQARLQPAERERRERDVVVGQLQGGQFAEPGERVVRYAVQPVLGEIEQVEDGERFERPDRDLLQQVVLEVEVLQYRLLPLEGILVDAAHLAAAQLHVVQLQVHEQAAVQLLDRGVVHVQQIERGRSRAGVLQIGHFPLPGALGRHWGCPGGQHHYHCSHPRYPPPTGSSSREYATIDSRFNETTEKRLARIESCSYVSRFSECKLYP
uniref:Uncharacterized protein n=1 Tax=Anopheles farauti TaxID=69004 RepID=A0A182Q1M7_9DIPT